MFLAFYTGLKQIMYKMLNFLTMCVLNIGIHLHGEHAYVWCIVILYKKLFYEFSCLILGPKPVYVEALASGTEINLTWVDNAEVEASKLLVHTYQLEPMTDSLGIIF